MGLEDGIDTNLSGVSAFHHETHHWLVRSRTSGSVRNNGSDYADGFDESGPGGASCRSEY
jgi:hypothetical protein